MYKIFSIKKSLFYQRFILLQKRLHDDIDEENSENYRSIKRSKIIDESNKENDLIINRPSIIKRSRRGIGVCVLIIYLFIY